MRIQRVADRRERRIAKWYGRTGVKLTLVDCLRLAEMFANQYLKWK